MKSVLLFTVFAVILGYAAQKPNIVFFLVDDMGWQDTSVPFYQDTTDNNRKFKTPNMENLARSGITFTNAYAHSVCSPSRITLKNSRS